MQKLSRSLERLFATLLILVILTLVSVYVFDQLFAQQIGIASFFQQAGRISIVIISGSIAILLIRRSKRILSKFIGVHVASLFQILLILTALIVMIFSILHILQVSLSSLLISGGIVSIVFGLIVSSFVGNLLAGNFVLMTRPYKIGDTILINNIPCRVEQITSLVTRVKNDFGGQMIIPNTAIMQGNVIVTSFQSQDLDPIKRLPYALGDRIYTTYLNQEGVVTDLTPFLTKILLDSGKEVTFLNTSVLLGSVAVARIQQQTKT